MYKNLHSSLPSQRNVLRDLNDATLQGAKMDTIGDSSPDSILAREAELLIEKLDISALAYAYANTKTRVIIIDFNGTLVVKEREYSLCCFFAHMMHTNLPTSFLLCPSCSCWEILEKGDIGYFWFQAFTLNDPCASTIMCRS